MDGDLSDWTEVLTNPENVSRDGDGSSLGCSGSTDLDCAIAAGDLDLARFAWTWDVDNLYLYVERRATGVRAAFAYVYLDLDSDDLMESSDVVIRLELAVNTRFQDSEAFAYVPSAPGGDPLVDAAGRADGYDMPGRLGVAINGNDGDFMAPAIGATAWEANVRWGRLGGVDGIPMKFHVSLGTSGTLPSGITDNVGATGGGAGTTAHRTLRVYPDRSASTAPGRTVLLPHVMENIGNVPVGISYSVRSSTGQDLTIWKDTDVDAVPDLWLAHDAGGDGILTLPGDYIAPDGDSDGDGVLDTGVLAMGDFVLVFIEETFAPDAGGLHERIDIDAWIDPSVPPAHAVDLVNVGSVTIVADQERSGVAGDVAWVPHVVQNNTFTLTTIDLSVVSTRGWTWDLFTDPAPAGDPAGSLPLVDSDGSGLPDVTLQPGQFAAILARASVPATAPLGRQEIAYVRAHLQGIPESLVTDRVIVMPAMDLSPSYLAAAGQARYGGAGGRIYFAHRLLSHVGTSETFTITATSDLGWPATLLTDEDADGRPYDSRPFAGPSVTLAANDGELAFIVAVDVPAGARLGDLTAVDVVASTAGGASAAVQDDALAAIVRLYAEAAHVLDVTRLGDCATGHAFASGLPPSAPDYRFAWRDAADVVFRATPVTTDAAGSCEDAATLAPGQLGQGWHVDIQRWDGIAWVTLDSAPFEIGDGWRVESLATELPRYDLAVDRITASAVMVNDAFEQAVTDVVRWIVLDEARATYLDASGDFLPFTGTEATATEIVQLASREEALSMIVSNARFPGTGTYLLEAWRSSPCSGERLSQATTFEVIDDADGDGLTRDEELAGGSDPSDDDSDDDGLTDGLDGLGDTDGDGAIDARDCDSDGDGLPDGLEAGAWEPAAGTAPGSPCFAADAWPPTTTDPDVADTDGGGMPDGLEDADGDGRRDADEGDPGDPSDDLTHDADGDALGDFDEWRRGTDPRDADTDDDGLPDGIDPNPRSAFLP
jgi:hypothetical protein